MPPGENGQHKLPVATLMTADSPRVAGVDKAHVRVLAELVPDLPPILVHRRTRRIIDGMHRAQAHRLRGYDEIAVEFFDGADDEAFIVAVKTNLYHGLPLTLDDRRAAALRILRENPHSSDRGVAGIVGLSARTVRKLREESSAEITRPPARVGLDGRIRPLDVTHARRVAGELLKNNPQASLRQIARDAGISPTTVRDVRDRMQRGEDPAGRSVRPRAAPVHPPPPEPVVTARSLMAELSKLRQDPSLRYSVEGRSLVRWLELHLPVGWDQLPPVVPPHSAELVSRIARSCADEWRAFARELDTQ